MSAPEPAVLYKVTPEGVAVVTLNRPDNMNAWSDEIAHGLFDAYDRAIAEPEVRVILVTGRGRAFCAGADMKGTAGLASMARGVSEAKDVELAAGLVNDPKGRPFDYALHVPKPIIACINGACAGIGLMQALACDVRFAAAGAKFTTAFARRGLIAEGGISGLLPRLAGTGSALDLLLSARVFLAEEALRLGVVQAVLPGQDVFDGALRYAADLAVNCPVSSTAVIKQQVLRHQRVEQELALRESNKLMMAGPKPDSREGIAAFVQKRAPRFLPFDPESPLQRLKEELLQERQENASLREALRRAKAALSKL